MKKNILAENMRRFGTKNLSEQNFGDLENKLGFDDGANRDPKTGNLMNPASNQPNQPNQQQYTADDFPVGAKVHIDDETWIVVNPGVQRNHVFMRPYDRSARERYVSVAIEFDLNYLNGAVTDISLDY